MNLAIRRITVYLKLVAIIAVVVLALLVVLMNRSHTADIWFFRKYEQVNVIYLILVTAGSSIVGWWIVRKIFKVLREMRELRQARALKAVEQRQRQREQELADREKRIDQKVRREITDDPAKGA